MSKSIRTVIADDESLARRGLKMRLADHPDIDIVAECSNGREAIEAANTLEPDLLFLDIQMPRLDGFDVIHRIQSDNLPLVIFATAFDHYAVEAFEVHAVDYLLKPVEPERLTAALNRVRERLGKKRSELEKHKLLSLLSEWDRQGHGQFAVRIRELVSADGPVTETLVIRDGHDIHRVNIDDIDWIDAAGDYMCLHVGEHTHVMRATMKELQSKLPPTQFVRIHRSTLVNSHRVIRVEASAFGKHSVVLANGASLTMSRGQREQLEALLQP